MATGIETAGLVLAAFPLLVSAAEHYREGYEKISDWYHFRPNFTAFCHTLRTQRALFENNLEELLTTVVHSDLELKCLMQDPGGPSWLNLEDRLKRRLPRSYDQYRVTMDEINRIMAKLLKTEFGIEQVIATTTPFLPEDRLDFEKERIKFTWNRRKREKRLSALVKHNSELKELLHSSDRVILARSRRKPSSTTSPQFRIRACNLHAIITQGWRCTCSATHDTKLLLKKREHTTASKGLLSDNAGVSVDTFDLLFTFQTRLKARESSPWKWQQAKVKVDEYIGTDDDVASQVSRLRVDKPLPAVPGTSHIAGASETSNSRRVTFAASPNVASASEPRTVHSQEIRNLCAAMQNLPHEEYCLGFLLDQNRQRHEFYALPKAVTTSDTGETVTLDSLLTTHGQPWTLDTNGRAPRLTRRERMSLAATLASSAIELCNTPWLGGDWNKKHIAFLKASAGCARPIVVDQPYISPSQDRTIDDKPLESMNAAIFCLGVLLLELWFGESLEEQLFRSQYLGPNGRPNDFTDFATAAAWHRQIADDAGTQLAGVIGSCIFCNIRTRTPASTETALREAMYAEVMLPLEGICRAFAGVEVHGLTVM
ncbi:hypothetical protein MMC26_004261 [Xylographa opegraphella]|nr:hypothetical protein [Xylographa opegraphella]